MSEIQNRPDIIRIAVAQLNPTVGDIAGNLAKAREARADAARQGADLVLFTELFLCGYPPEDLVLKPAFLGACARAVEHLAADTADGGPAVIIGFPRSDGALRHNSIAVLDAGEVIAMRDKVDLPNYGEFDEKRVFHVGEMGSGHVVKLLNNFVAQAICTATAEAFAGGAKAGVDLDKVVQVISAGGVNSGLFQLMSKTLQGDYGAMKFELNNAAKDLRYYSHLTESVKVPSIIGTSVHQALNTAVALGYGSEMVPSLVKAQAQLNQVTIVKA